MLKRITGLLCLMVIVLAGTAAAQPPPVADFTIVGPPVVILGQPFPIDVIEADNNWRPITPGHPEIVYLFASDNEGNPVPISPSSFPASGSGDDIVMVMVDTHPGATIFIHAQGYGVGHPAGPNAPPIWIAGGPGEPAQFFGVSAPMSANPNQPFPVYITPLWPGPISGEVHPAAFNGVVNLEGENHEGNPVPISPTSWFLGLQAGQSARVLVTLDSVSPMNKIHVRREDGPDGGGPTPRFDVTFHNNDQNQVNAFVYNFLLMPNLTLNDGPLSIYGVQAGMEWRSTIWPIRHHNDGPPNPNGPNNPDGPPAGWNMVSFIPGAGPMGFGVELHTTLIPIDVPLGDLPGNPDLWNPGFVVNTVNWPLNLDSGPFPPGLDGVYWIKQEILSLGDHPGTNVSFVNNSPQLDRPLLLIEPDGRSNGEPEILSMHPGIKGGAWHNMIWEDAPGNRIFHVLTQFSLPTGPDTFGDVWIHGIFVPFVPALPPPIYPDAAGWNAQYIVDPQNDFADVDGGLPEGFAGSFWARFEILADPGGDGDGGPGMFGWSNPINTTGMHVAGTTIHVDEVFGAPGAAVIVPVTLHSDQWVAGLQFTIEPQHWDGDNHFHAGEVTFEGAINDLENQGFSVLTSTDEQGRTRILVFNLRDGNPLPPGEHVLMELVFRIDEQRAHFGDWIMLALSDAVISDPGSQPIPYNLWNGSIHVGVQGDLNETGDINILDIIQEIKYVLRRLPLPNDPFVYFLADMNHDGHIDVLDVVRMINIVLGRAAVKPVAGPTSPVQMAFGDLQASPTGPSLLPIQAQFDGAVAGLQLTLRYDPTTLTLGPVQPTDALAGLTVDSQAAAGTLTVLIYSPEGRVLRASNLSSLLMIPVTGTGTVDLTQALVADAQAGRVPTTITTGTVKVAPLPTAWGLKSAQPNPFNPTTRLAYDVPQAGHIVLAVYNLLGQEVIRLVDGVQQPGRYVVSWDGRNGQGLSVASGVYLYRLTASTGFSQTRRMTLLK